MKNTILTDRITTHQDHIEHIFAEKTLERLFALNARFSQHGYSIEKINVRKRYVWVKVTSPGFQSSGTYRTLEDFLTEETARLDQMDKMKAA